MSIIKLINYFREHKRATIPEIQHEFSLKYSEAREEFRKLFRVNKIKLIDGLTFEWCGDVVSPKDNIVTTANNVGDKTQLDVKGADNGNVVDNGDGDNGVLDYEEYLAILNKTKKDATTITNQDDGNDIDCIDIDLDEDDEDDDDDLEICLDDDDEDEEDDALKARRDYIQQRRNELLAKLDEMRKEQQAPDKPSTNVDSSEQDQLFVSMKKEVDKPNLSVTSCDQVDPLCKKALRFWLEKNNGKASIASIQRNLGIGFNRAGRIFDTLQKLGYVEQRLADCAPQPLRVLVTLDDLDKLFPNLPD